MYGLFTDYLPKPCYGRGHLRGDKALTIYLLAGPPFGPQFWDSCIQRLHFHGRRAEALNPFQYSCQLEELSQIVSTKLQKDDVLVAHGTALPIAIQASKLQQFRLTVLCNGPLVQADRFLQIFSSLPAAARRFLLSSPIAFPYLSSSLGLRRLVVNPYVMDHDTIVTVCSGLKKDTKELSNYVAYTNIFRKKLQADFSPTMSYLFLWGDQDFLYPKTPIQNLLSKLKNSTYIGIPGGKNLYPIERPWAFADALHQQLKTPCAT